MASMQTGRATRAKTAARLVPGCKDDSRTQALASDWKPRIASGLGRRKHSEGWTPCAVAAEGACQAGQKELVLVHFLLVCSTASADSQNTPPPSVATKVNGCRRALKTMKARQPFGEEQTRASNNVPLFGYAVTWLSPGSTFSTPFVWSGSAAKSKRFVILM